MSRSTEMDHLCRQGDTHGYEAQKWSRGLLGRGNDIYPGNWDGCLPKNRITNDVSQLTFQNMQCPCRESPSFLSGCNY